MLHLTQNKIKIKHNKRAPILVVLDVTKNQKQSKQNPGSTHVVIDVTENQNQSKTKSAANHVI